MKWIIVAVSIITITRPLSTGQEQHIEKRI